ncbi:SOS response-associated peptidase [Candidatus Puniceispirillum sp.]|nr:SOS response-associated peptidase [Candidatus Puniceispirillum sp.]
MHAEATNALWGLPPAGGLKTVLINARVETVYEKSTFRDVFAYSRCIIVASGCYEWSAPKTPWYIQFFNGGVMAMGGLLFCLEGRSRFMIMTSAADGELAEIHYR